MLLFILSDEGDLLIYHGLVLFILNAKGLFLRFT